MNRILQLVSALAILSLLASCSPGGGFIQDPAGRHPFALDIAGENGTLIHWQAPAGGYQPGATESMRLGISNNTDQPWHGRLCVQLLEPDPSPAVRPLLERTFSLEPGLGFEDTLSVALPADLPPGTYGLALVVHRPAGPAVDVVSIQVGEGSQERPVDPWSTEAALRACPQPGNDN